MALYHSTTSYADGVRRRNLIDNAGFRVAQRGSGTVAVGNVAAGYFTADRWYTNNGGAGAWDQAVVDVVTPSGLRKALRMTVTTADASLAAGDFCVINHGIEGYTIARALASTTSLKAMSLAFDAFSNVAGTYVYEIFQWNASGTLTRSISAAFTLAASTWTHVNIPLPPDTSADIAIDNKVGLSLQLYLAAGSTYQGGSLKTSWVAGSGTANTRANGQVNVAATVSNAFHITEVQLEVGAPTSFEALSYDEDLRRCRRYFQRWTQPPLRGVVGTGVTVARLGMPLPVTMRAAPSWTISGAGQLWLYDGSQSNSISTLGANLGTTGDVVEADAACAAGWTVTGRACVLYQNTGYIDISAEI